MDARNPESDSRLILDYYSQNPPPWIEDSHSMVKKKKIIEKDVQVVEEVLRSLKLAAEYFRNRWNWSEFASRYLNHDDSYVVWLACQCMAIILQLTESEKKLLVNQYMDQKTNMNYMLSYNLKPKTNDMVYQKSSLANQYITVEEVSLPIVGFPKQQNELIFVNSTKHNLRNLALSVSAGKVACLVGPVGSGKSALVHHIANITGHTDEKLLTVQLGDETDSKMMLGSYHCTDIPGEFVWQPGVLTKAVVEGHWLLLEDIDSASSDLAALLVSLIENQSLTVPGFRDQIIPTTGFQLFLTRRVIATTTGYYYKQNIATDLLGKHYIQVNVEPLSKDELIEVIETKFPVLKTIAPKIIEVFLMFSAGFHDDDVVLNLKSNSRLTSTRDLMKWCARIVKEYNVTSSESALRVIQDAIDIFCCSSGDSITRVELARLVASKIGVVKTKAEFFLNEYKPTIVLDEKHCIAGRVTLLRTGSFLTDNNITISKFALTRSSSCLLERIACCIAFQESVLLVGETGTGKTSTLQLLAKHTGNKLIVLNMNQQSDSVDLIGGYKPVELKIIFKSIREEFETLFRAEFDVIQNTKFLGHISTCFNNREWSKLIKLIKHVLQKAIDKNIKNKKSIKSWSDLSEKLIRFEEQLKHCQTEMAFAFIEGSLIHAVKEGYWVLLDEINLASAETLQCLSSLLESGGTISIYEKTDSKPITRHPNFRLMAAMNPSTDVGKKDLPPGIRNRFTEFFVDELTERSDLITLTACYLSDFSAEKLNAISKFYLIVKREAEQSLVDGTGHKPHYSLRTYCRALAIASLNPCQSTQRSLFESFSLSFLTQLDNVSHQKVESLIANTIIGKNIIPGVINQPIPKPLTKTESYVQFEGYWIQKGGLDLSVSKKYILTESVKKNLRDLVRAVSLSNYPILIQGDTCVGKTSLITYLAAASGNNLVRINNHEHTDLQEYIGSYSAQSITGQLVFQEGVLVDAMRKGHWIVLDELNLAPTDVLEALNRVLDDNRELFIPETQTTVKAHPRFRLFATQNPPGLYGGRKILSRAFKNRFIEMHFQEIAADELQIILSNRCEMPSSYAKKVVSVMKELQSTRKGSAAFAGKHGFITFRDLFRWGERYRLAKAPDNYNWNQHLVDEGFLVLSSKVRKPEEEKTIINVLEKYFKCPVSLDRLFTLNEKTSPITRHILQRIKEPPNGFKHVYMSKNIRRMVVLSCKAIEFNEPILLVGETGCGKTTVCQMIAAMSEKKLLTVNCHQLTESSDFLGGLRPVRNKDRENDQRLFEWVDGPLIEAIVNGHMFLADEISLADDSVLERFNSLLEPERKLLLSEKIVDSDNSEIIAHPKFSFIGTMNPGGDYGKKELSPALRNRLTEIWCESCCDNDDLSNIIMQNMTIFGPNDKNEYYDYSLPNDEGFINFFFGGKVHNIDDDPYNLVLSKAMVDFIHWLKTTEHIKNYLKLNISIRDYLIWLKFIESLVNKIPHHVTYDCLHTIYTEGANMTFLNKKSNEPGYDKQITHALEFSLNNLFTRETKYHDVQRPYSDIGQFLPLPSPEWFGFSGYYILRGNSPMELDPPFSFNSPTTKENVIRLLRCMQLDDKAILLEGSPGVGKTSLIQAVSKASGHKLIRINLSEQTDVSDLFGADLPTDGGESGSFEWRDGPFLRALKEGNWILLDELNLASQSVLEGLNAVLDHRGELFIPELGRTFIIESKKTRIFACQNPLSEGGARKGLPKSFLNRFLQVHLNVLNNDDIIKIMKTVYAPQKKKIRSIKLQEIVDFSLGISSRFKMDINLRDILRWVDVTISLKCNILDHLPLIITDRIDSLKKDEDYVFEKMKQILETDCYKYDFIRVFPSAIMFSRIVIPRERAVCVPVDQSNTKMILRSHTHTLNSLAVCVKMNWMPILVGSGCGKTSLVKTLAQLCGRELRVLSVNAAMDTIEILGGFEQADFNRHLDEFAKKIEKMMYNKASQQLLKGQNDYILLLDLWNEYNKLTDVSNNVVTTMASETTLFKKRIVNLIQITNALEDFDLSYALQTLGERVCATGNLNSSGKFEWIDSILVKCLKNGDWLLIDNVNLCSPAVLDRLNGLLEPNGVLVLGEKGINSDGQITTIKPHKDFRLFLAMDPKHGTISKAMKNRGVEICMLPLEKLNAHDMYSMLELQGLFDKKIKRSLINIHQALQESINLLGTGNMFGINHLLRAAYLISQNIRQGRPLMTTIREICIDVYARYLNGTLKQNTILEIDRILEKLHEKDDKTVFKTIKTLDILQCANICYVKQHCSILEHFQTFVMINDKEIDIRLEDMMLCYFGRSSKSDIAIRSQWFLKRLESDDETMLQFKESIKLQRLNVKGVEHFVKKVQTLDFDNLCFATKTVENIDSDDLPYDFRYIPPTYINKGYPVDEIIPLAENKIHLMFDHVMNRVLIEDLSDIFLARKKAYIERGGIFHDYAILSLALDDFIDFFMEEHSLKIDERNCHIFKKIIYYIRLVERKILGNDDKPEYVVTLIHCYFDFVVEQFLPMIESISRGERLPYLERLKTMQIEVLRNYLTPKRHGQHIQYFKRHMYLPNPQCCKCHGKINISLYGRSLSLVADIKSNHIEALITPKIKDERKYLLLNYNKDSCTCQNQCYKQVNGPEMNDMELNLIPLWELVIERNFFIIANGDDIEQRSVTNYTFYSYLKALLLFVPTVSPLYYNSLNFFHNIDINLLVQGLNHSLNSVAVENPNLYLDWSPNKNINVKNHDTTSEESVYSFEQPLFTVFITHLLLKKKEPYYSFSPKPIRLIQKNNNNLMCIKSFIWNISKLTTNAEFDNIEALLKSVDLFFKPLLPEEFTTLHELHLSNNDEESRVSVAAKVDYHDTMLKAIYDAAYEVSHTKSNINLYYHRKNLNDCELDNLNKQIQFGAGRLWILTGMCLLEIFTALKPVDPQLKVRVQNKCSENEERKIRSRFYAEKLFCEVDGITELFPFKEHYLKRLKPATGIKIPHAGYRPDPPQYNFILNEVTQFSKMYGLESKTYDMINTSRKDYEALVNEMDNWLSSVTNFYNKLEEYNVTYPDILCGILFAINQMRYGMRMLKNHYKWTVNKGEHITCEEELLTLFGEFPRFCPDIIKMVNMDEAVLMNINDKFRWYKICLEELNNMLYLSKQSSRTDRYIKTIRYVLEKFVCNWKRLQEEEENKKLEEESIYKQKSMCETIPIEIEIAQGVAKQFPTTKNSDFDDIEGPHILDSDVPQDTKILELYNLTDKDVNDICRLHTELIRPAAVAHWLPQLPVKFDKNESVIKIKDTFSDRFCLFGKLILTKFMYLDSLMDAKMMPWLLIATDIANNPKKLDNKGYYDFYRDSNIEYAQKTYDVLINVEEKIQELLSEWPDHPTLQTINKIVERIMGFDWSSPTCRFLIGLELLLTKLHEWEEVAHRGISVRELTLTITNCIQEYRSLELSTWKDCLKTSLKKIQNDSSKWWFHLYSIFQGYLNKQENFQQLVSAIQKFMESSSLGQYMSRLELLYTFHCDVVCREKSIEQTELCNASWNLYKYYSQFKDSINHRIETLSADTKKKLQGFIKIVKWNDINYWSVKETVTKVQQNLHKYTREYEEILNNSASWAMITQSSIIASQSDAYVFPSFDFAIYLKIYSKFSAIETIEPETKNNMLNNINRYSIKASTFAQKTMNRCTYASRINELNNFINGIMESAEELRDLNIDLKAPKEKQKSHAKQILQQKRKALSELFKGLQQIGLSYKSGLMGCEQTDGHIEFARLPPLDINTALEFLTPKEVDDDLRYAWRDCESYFLKSVSQTAALKVASETPKLGNQDMVRIKGFINDLKKITWNAKKVLASNIDSLVQFRSLIHLSDIITQNESVIFNPSEELQQPINYVINSINIFQQFKVAIESCKENVDSTSVDSVSTFLDYADLHSPGTTKFSNDVITNLNGIIDLAQNTLDIVIEKKTHNAMKLCNVEFMIKDTYDKSIQICNTINKYITQFYNKIWIGKNNTINKNDFRLEPEQFVSNANKPPMEKIVCLTNKIFKSIENLYKKHIDNENENDNKLLKSQIIKPLSLDLENCNLSAINELLKNVLESSIGNSELRCCFPLFEQYALIVQFFITQQTMAYRVLSKMNYLLSKLFTDLASNGFCVPDELLDGEGETQSDGKSGMGLTEGEGAKDVSDQIESQDQLEDAKKDYNEEQDTDKDLKEEEKGVEMSDDFDGKLHDMEKEEEDENTDNDDNDDNDKEMGETGEGADTLDEKLWGSDSEDDNGDEQENEELKEEDGKGGEAMGDKELKAKSDKDNIEEQDEREELNQKNNKKDINEMDEDGEDAGEDHADPNHGNLQPPPEPEPMDLPNDLQLDEGEMNDNEEGEENPFDIDAMKESMDLEENDDDDIKEPKEDKTNLEDTSDEEIDDESKIDDTKAESDNEGEENKEDGSNDDGGKKDENKTGNEPKEEDEIKEHEDKEAKPSEDDPSNVEAQPSNFENDGSKDQVCENADGKDHDGDVEKNKEEATGPEQQGVGRSQRESQDTKQGHSVNENKGTQTEEPGTKNKKRRMNPGQKELDRTLAKSSGPMMKRLKTTDTQDENNDDGEDNGSNENKDDDKKKGELFKHVQESKDGDTETLDAATNEQLEKRPLPNDEDQTGEELKDENLEMEIEENDEDKTQNGEEILPDKVKSKKLNKQSVSNEPNNLEEDENHVEPINVDGEVILTHTVERGMDTKFHTVELSDHIEHSLSIKDYDEDFVNQLNEWSENDLVNVDGAKAWNNCMDKTSCLAQELSEQLRLVLEPSKTSRLQGDFRTGRRINMRRIIPYIASQFRKDKIWLRRTRPSKRQYQIIMAVDNSSSMLDSHAKTLTFESLALVCKALTLIEAGELGVMSFGEQPRVVHPLGVPFTDETGGRLIQQFTFDEQKTKVGELIELATAAFKNRGRLDTGDQPAQLLIIMSDGRGIKSEGPDVVKNAIRTAHAMGIFIVFIVVDNPVSKESILDIKMPIFENNSVRIESYMDNFPFPFYIILRDVDKLPVVLSDALREWFELVTN